jgi:hypothetical protein
MNTNQIIQPPTFIPPPQQFMPAQNGIVIPPALPTPAEKQKGKIINIAFFATLAFFVLSHPIAYRITNQVFTAFTGKINEILSEVGCPTMKGNFLHTVVFFVFMLFLLSQKK